MNKVAATFIALLTLLASMNVKANLVIEEGKQFARAPADIAENALVKEMAKDPSQVYVMEFFSYGCAGCHKLDPLVEQWRTKLPPNVNFQRIPVEFHTEWRNLTKAYFTAVNLNVMDKIHTPFFDAIHSNKITSSSDDTIRQFFTSQGVPQKDFDQEFDSFSLNRKQKWAGNITRAYRVTAVPAFIVQGPKGIFVTTARLAGSFENVMATVDYLIKVETGEIQLPAVSLQPTATPAPVATTTEASPPPTKTSVFQRFLARFKTSK